MSIDTATMVCRNDDLLVQPVDDDIVMADIVAGNYYGLAGSARVIWDLLAVPSSVSALCDALGERFTVDRATCEEDTLAFVHDMMTAGLLRIAA